MNMSFESIPVKLSKLTGRLIGVALVIALGACASLPENTGRTESYAYEDTQETALSLAYDSLSQGHTGESGFYYLSNGLDAFVARASLADVAERSIDTQYYIEQFGDDGRDPGKMPGAMRAFERIG